MTSHQKRVDNIISDRPVLKSDAHPRATPPRHSVLGALLLLRSTHAQQAPASEPRRPPTALPLLLLLPLLLRIATPVFGERAISLPSALGISRARRSQDAHGAALGEARRRHFEESNAQRTDQGLHSGCRSRGRVCLMWRVLQS